jgi:hypothetical protein
MAKFLRYLRIAFSALCLIACALLCVLWVRSYTTRDRWTSGIGIHCITGSTVNGRLRFSALHWDNTAPSLVIHSSEPVTINSTRETLWAFHFRRFSSHNYLSVPIWFAILFSAALSITPWLYWRYSLRTLLIVTTLIAVVLGVVVYAVR